MPRRDRVDGRVAPDPPHAGDDLVDGRSGERVAHHAVGAEWSEAPGADAHDLPADLAERFVLLEVGGLLEADVVST